MANGQKKIACENIKKKHGTTENLGRRFLYSLEHTEMSMETFEKAFLLFKKSFANISYVNNKESDELG